MCAGLHALFASKLDVEIFFFALFVRKILSDCQWDIFLNIFRHSEIPFLCALNYRFHRCFSERDVPFLLENLLV